MNNNEYFLIMRYESKCRRWDKRDRLNNKITSFCRVNDNLNARKKIFKATVFLSYSANQLEELQKQKQKYLIQSLVY